MLQQTQVSTVLDRYYTPFLAQFPTLSALASAPRETVLKAWQGLGYYRRAINLHEAAKRCNGSLPREVEELMALPGIGRNTAHAVAAFAYGARVPVMEANVKRVLARLYALTHPQEAELWTLAAKLCSGADSFIHNQAMMDLGAMVCTPKHPQCSACPVAGECKGKATPLAYPAPSIAKTVPIHSRRIFIIEHDSCVYMKPRAGKHLGALYHFLETDDAIDTLTLNDHTIALKSLKSVPLTHHYSHYTLHAQIYHLVMEPSFKRNTNHWWTRAELRTLPMSKLEEKCLEKLS